MADQTKNTVKEFFSGAKRWAYIVIAIIALITILHILNDAVNGNPSVRASKGKKMVPASNIEEIPIYVGKWSQPIYSNGPHDRLEWGVVETDVGVITQVNDTLLITQPPLSDELWRPIEGSEVINKVRFMIDPENAKRHRATIRLTYLDR